MTTPQRVSMDALAFFSILKEVEKRTREEVEGRLGRALEDVSATANMHFNRARDAEARHESYKTESGQLMEMARTKIDEQRDTISSHLESIANFQERIGSALGALDVDTDAWRDDVMTMLDGLGTAYAIETPESRAVKRNPDIEAYRGRILGALTAMVRRVDVAGDALRGEERDR